jgi:MYXO-CTERM domain-containing protein
MISKWYQAAGTCGAILSLCGATRAADAVITVDATRVHQTMYGFGATTLSLAFAATDNVPANLRTQAIQALYRDVRLNTGNLEVEPFEAPASNVFAPANDNDDPAILNASAFNWIQSQNMHDLVVAPGTQYGFKDYFIGPVAGTGFSLAWVNSYRASNYNRYLDEIAEHVVAVATHWRDTYQTTPPLLMLFNEPTSGNGELSGGTPQMIADIVSRAGARIRAGGFPDIRFLVPCEEREDISLNNARTVLQDANARPYVGAIGYHPYPYGSTYAAVANIIATSGAGKPDAGKVALRNQLRDLGAMYKVPVFMTEVSHSEKPFDDFDNVRGRAIHIHDELVYADAAAFFGMNAMWDSVSHAQHYMGRADPGFYSETDTVVLIDVAMGKVVISGMGRAIGHYARWLRRGATRIDATSADPLVLATAFVDASQGRAVVVAINNTDADRPLDIAFSGVDLSGVVEGELSKAGSLWTAVSGVTASAGHVKYLLPTHAVVTLSAAVRGLVLPEGGVDAATMTGSGGNATGSGGNATTGGAAGTTAGDNSIGAGGAPNASGGNSGVGGTPSVNAGGVNSNADTAADSSGGCGCKIGSKQATSSGAWGALLLVACFTIRRRPRSSGNSEASALSCAG